MDFANVSAQLRSFENQEHGPGATQQEIASAEARLGVQFRGGYLQFLTEFGWVVIGDLEIAGLGADVPSYLDLVRLTLSERDEMEPALPPNLIPIHNDGGGNHYCLDASESWRSEMPIVFWDHDAGVEQVPAEVSPDFASWLAAHLVRLSSNVI